jgi:hypothetical protein
MRESNKTTSAASAARGRLTVLRMSPVKGVIEGLDRAVARLHDVHAASRRVSRRRGHRRGGRRSLTQDA